MTLAAPAQRRLFHVISDLSPLAAIALLLTVPLALPTGGTITPEMLAHTERIVAAIDTAPWVVGRWIGRGVTVPPAAWEILKPSAILSRRYIATMGDGQQSGAGCEVTFTVIHCNDMRDMNGHYPPICYPAHGWLPDDADIRAVNWTSESLGEQTIMHYRFHRRTAENLVDYLHVLNFFVMPDGRITPDMDALRSVTRWRSQSLRGVAQVQLVYGRSMDREQALQAMTELVDGMPQLFEILRSQPTLESY